VYFTYYIVKLKTCFLKIFNIGLKLKLYVYSFYIYIYIWLSEFSIVSVILKPEISNNSFNLRSKFFKYPTLFVVLLNIP